ncbi:MAG: PLxRFG domain-containing protein [Proteobacteria bacterium]|nr:PLxRFG domain-containing protein [Pseudomonadota bacterium]
MPQQIELIPLDEEQPRVPAAGRQIMLVPLDDDQPEEKPSFVERFVMPGVEAAQAAQPVAAPKQDDDLWDMGSLKASFQPYADAARGLAAGSASVGESVGSGIQYLGNRFGADGMAGAGKDLADYYSKQGEAFAPPERIQGNVLDNPRLLGDPSWWAYNTAQMVPSLAAAMLPGAGAGKAVQIGGKALQLTPQVIARAAAFAQAVGAGTAGGALEGASTYREVLNNGGGEEEAARAAEIMGLGSTVLNAASFGTMLGKAGTGAAAKVGKHVLSAATEGVSEAAEEPWEEYAKSFAHYLETGDFDPKTWTKMVDAAKTRGLNVLGPAALTGGAGSMIAGGSESDGQTEQIAPQSNPQGRPVDLIPLEDTEAEPLTLGEEQLVQRGDAAFPKQQDQFLERAGQEREVPLDLTRIEQRGYPDAVEFDLDQAGREAARARYLESGQEQAATPQPVGPEGERAADLLRGLNRNLPVPFEARPDGTPIAMGEAQGTPIELVPMDEAQPVVADETQAKPVVIGEKPAQQTQEFQSVQVENMPGPDFEQLDGFLRRTPEMVPGRVVDAPMAREQKQENQERLPQEALRPMAQRIVNAENSFITSVMEQFGKSREQAENVLGEFKKAKVVKIDPVGGQYQLKDGRLWEQEVIDRAAGAKVEQTAGAYGIESHDAFVERMRSGEVTPNEIRGTLERAIEQEANIKAELSKLTKDKLLKMMGGITASRYKSERKEIVVRAAYDDMLMDFAMGGGLSFMVTGKASDSRAKALREKVLAYTKDDIKAYAERVQKARDDYAERVRAFKKAQDNPETLQEFKDFVGAQGEGKLTVEQRAKYDALRAEEARRVQQAEVERKGTVSQVRGMDDVDMELVETKHTRDGHDLFVVRLSDRVDKDKYRELLTKAKRLGGYYSRYAKGGAIPGFQFKTRAQADDFMALKEQSVSVAEQQAERKEEKRTKARSKLREAADAMDAKADEALGADRKTNTVKRAREAGYAEEQAQKQKAMAATMRRIADAVESGEAPALAGLTQKVQMERLESLLRRGQFERVRSENLPHEEGREIVAADIEHVKMPVPSIWRENIESLARDLSEMPGGKALAKQVRARISRGSGDSYVFNGTGDEELARKIRDKLKANGVTHQWWTIIETIPDVDRLARMGITKEFQLRDALRQYFSLRKAKAKADPLKAMERDLIGKKIPGFFPTPARIVGRMIEEAGIEPGMKVLEPSAGKGSIADKIREAEPGADLDTVEQNHSLRGILEAKGHRLVGSDFLEHQENYDRIVMNPPFENHQDIEHVRHAYDLLKPGGRIVSIMSSGPFFRSQRADVEFRSWLENIGATYEQLPEGTFKDSDVPTGTSTYMVTIDKSDGDVVESNQKRTDYEDDTRRKETTSPSRGQVEPQGQQGRQDAAQSQAERLRREIVEAAQVEHFFEDGKTVFDSFAFFNKLQEVVESGQMTLDEAMVFVRDTEKRVENLMQDVDEVPFGGSEGDVWIKDKIIEAMDAAAVEGIQRDTAIDEYARVLGALRQGRGLSYKSISENYGRDVARDLRDRFGPGIFKRDGWGADEIAGELGFIDDSGRADGHALIEYLQDKAKTKGQIDEDHPEPSVRFSRRRTSFYSALGRAVESMDFKAMPATALASRIKKTSGIKQEELDDLGLLEWLSTVDGKVTKEQVLAYIEAGGPQLEEVVKREGGNTWRGGAARANRVREALMEFFPGDTRLPNRESALERVELEDRPKINRLYDELDAASDLMMIPPDAMDDTKFSQYQLPGGENYREVLLKLPLTGQAVYDNLAMKMFGKSFKALDFAQSRQVTNARRNSKPYHGQHWVEENVLAHVRLNDRVGADGGKVLFIEEIQSDWHQEGRNKGYNGAGAEILKEYEALAMKNIHAGLTEQEKSRLLELRPLVAGKGAGGVPNAPFKKSWYLLAFKRVLRMAAEQGYDSVAWTPGEVQAERYDLSKQINMASAIANGDGTYNLVVEDKSGNEVSPYSRSGKTVTPQEMEDTIGKDLTAKIIAGADAAKGKPWPKTSPINPAFFTLRGLDLKVGGDGMKGFYDNILPKEVGKYVKKLDKDTKVGTTEVPVVAVGDQAPQEARTRGLDSDYKDVWSVPITDKMRLAVLQGQPLYSRRGQRNTKGISVNDVSQVVDRQQAMSDNAPEIKIIQAMNNLPVHVREEYERRGGGFPESAYDEQTGIVYFIANNIESMDRAYALWLHEAGLHNGVRGLFPSDTHYRNMMDHVYRSAPRNSLREIEKLYGFNPGKVEDRWQAAEEHLARIAEKVRMREVLAPRERNIWQRFVIALQRFMRRIFKGGTLADSDIVDIVLDAVRWTVTGKPTGGARVAYQRATGEAQARPTSTSRFSRSSRKRGPGSSAVPETEWTQDSAGQQVAADMRAWKKQVDEALAGTLPSRQILQVGTTPDVLQKLGAKGLPMAMRQSDLRKIVQTKHDIPAEIIKDLPLHMWQPLAVFDSSTTSNSFAVLTELEHNGEGLVAMVHLDVDDMGNLMMNKVASVHDRSGKDAGSPGWQWVVNQIREGRLRYYDKKRSSRWLKDRSGLQLPGVLQPESYRGKRILTEKDIVKPQGATLFSRSSEAPEMKGGVPTREQDPSFWATVREMKRQGALKPKDIRMLERIFRQPYWIAKEHEKFAPFIKIEQDREAARTDAQLRSWEEVNDHLKALDKDGKKTLSQVIWHIEGKKLKEVEAGKFLKDGVDENGHQKYRTNPKHYEQLFQTLTKHGIPEDVATAVAAVRRTLDRDMLAAYNRLRRMRESHEDAGYIEEYRTMMGQVHNYFPHVRRGTHYVRIFDKKTGETLYREHFSALPTMKKFVGATVMRKALAEVRKNNPDADLSWDWGKNEGLPEDVYGYTIPVDAMEQIINAAIDRQGGDKESRAKVKSLMHEAVSDVLKTRGWSRHTIKRQGIPGHEMNDIAGVLFDYKSGLYGWLTKMDAAKAFTGELYKIDAKKQPRLYGYSARYVQDMLQNADRVDQIVSMVKAGAFVKFLGGNLKTATLNLTQNLVAGVPRLYADTSAKTAAGYFKAAVDDLAAQAKVKTLQSDETKLLEDLYYSGVTADQYMRELQGEMRGVGGVAGAGLRKLNHGLGLPMSMAERYNRCSLALAAYRAARDGKVTAADTLQKAGKKKGEAWGYDEAKSFAEGIVYDSHFMYGKANRPELFRGGTGNKIMSAAYTFRTFSHGLLSLWRHLLTQKGWAGRRAFAMSLAANTALGGLTSLPLYALVVGLIRQLFGEDPAEEAMKLTDNQTMRDIIMYGITAPAGVTISGSLGMELPMFDRVAVDKPIDEQIKGKALELIGVPWALFEDVVDFAGHTAEGKFARATEDLAPAFLANIMKAYRLHSEGAYSASGRPINIPGESGPMKLTTGEAIAQGIGFYPLNRAKSYDLYKTVEELKVYRLNKQDELVREYLEAVREKDGEARAKVLSEWREWNRKMKDDGRPEFMIKPLPELSRRREKANQPSRQMRPRAEKLKSAYGLN